MSIKKGNRVGWTLYCVLASMLLSFHAVAEDKLPSDAELRATQATIKSTFADDFRKTAPDARKKLIEKLVRQASDPANDETLQYALLLEASDLAAQASDVSTVALVADELDRRYPTAAIPVRASLLDKAVRDAKDATGAGDLADEFLALSESAGWAGNFQAAQHASEQALKIARLIQSPGRVSNATAKLELFRELNIAAEASARTPVSPANASAVACFQCVVKHDWTGGLQSLAHGKDRQLAPLAVKDIANWKMPREWLSSGDAWYDFAVAAKTRPALVRLTALLRAVQWYQLAFKDLPGLQKLHVEKRLAAADALSPWQSRDAAAAELKAALLESKWTWHGPDVVMTFKEDGSVSHRGMHGKWEIAGPRRVILKIDNGDIMTFRFNTTLTHYVSLGRDFGGDRVGNN
jgi:hypothetical protein